MRRNVAIALLGFSLLVVSCGDDDAGQVTTSVSATTTTAGGSATTDSGTTAATVPDVGVGCTVEVTGSDPTSWVGPDGTSAFTTDYWYTEEELREQWGFIGDPTRGTFDEVMASGSPVFTLFLFNCQGPDQALVSFYLGDTSTRADLAFGPGSYVVAGQSFGTSLNPGEFAVIFAPNSTELWAIDGQGTINITEWSGEHLVGDFSFNAVEQFSDSPGSVVVTGTFALTCQASVSC